MTLWVFDALQIFSTKFDSTIMESLENDHVNLTIRVLLATLFGHFGSKKRSIWHLSSSIIEQLWNKDEMRPAVLLFISLNTPYEPAEGCTHR